MGRYDIVFVTEAPNDETVANFSLGLASLGNIRTETMRVFTEGTRRARCRADAATDSGEGAA